MVSLLFAVYSRVITLTRNDMRRLCINRISLNAIIISTYLCANSIEVESWTEVIRRKTFIAIQGHAVVVIKSAGLELVITTNCCLVKPCLFRSKSFFKLFYEFVDDIFPRCFFERRCFRMKNRHGKLCKVWGVRITFPWIAKDQRVYRLQLHTPIGNLIIIWTSNAVWILYTLTSQSLHFLNRVNRTMMNLDWQVQGRWRGE